MQLYEVPGQIAAAPQKLHSQVILDSHGGHVTSGPAGQIASSPDPPSPRSPPLRPAPRQAAADDRLCGPRPPAARQTHTGPPYLGLGPATPQHNRERMFLSRWVRLLIFPCQWQSRRGSCGMFAYVWCTVCHCCECVGLRTTLPQYFCFGVLAKPDAVPECMSPW